jgi:hypothetical protein
VLKVLKRIAFYLLIAIAVILVSFTASVFLFKDRIIQRFITEANKSLGTPVKIGKIDVTGWGNFPNIGIVFTDVYIEDSHEGLYPLFTAQAVSFYMNPIDAWNGNYLIHDLRINRSETHLKVDEKGQVNFNVTKKSDGKGSIALDLHNIQLNKTKVSYHDLKSLRHFDFESKKLGADVQLSRDVYQIMAAGDVIVVEMSLSGYRLMQNKKLMLDASLNYDNEKKAISIKSSKLTFEESLFDLSGDYFFKGTPKIDLVAKSKDADIQTILSLLPEQFSQSLREYKSKGDIYFNLTLKGEIDKNRNPLLSTSFGLKNVELVHPQYKSKLENANMEGSFATSSLSDLSKGRLFLKNIEGKLNGQPISADFSITDFNDPLVSLDFHGLLESTSLVNFYPLKEFASLSGKIETNLSLSGRLSDLKKKSTAQHVKVNGDVNLKDVGFAFGPRKINFQNISGGFQFNNNDIAMSNVNGKIGNTDFLLNGFLKNVISFLLFDNQPIGIEADLKSNFIDLDQTISWGLGVTGSKDFGFAISPHLHLNFNCDVNEMKYKRFHPREIKGNLLVKNQTALSRNITFKAMGGDLSVNGMVDARTTGKMDVSSSFKLNSIELDSVFYVFDNFYQSFVQDKHLKGKAFADVNMEMTLNRGLKLYSETLVADINATIKGGELNGFEPLQKLNKYIDDETLSKLRFADLKNDIHIENRTIYIPQMEVRSNATTINLTGTHTFDQQIDYRIVTPLRSKKKIDPDEAFGSIEDDGHGRSKLFLKIIGTTDNYTVSLDKDALKKKITSDLKKEVKELKDAFKLKGKKKQKELELEKDDYFDWDDNQQN